MSENNHYPNIVLGCGEAGKYIGWTLEEQARRRRSSNDSMSTAAPIN